MGRRGIKVSDRQTPWFVVLLAAGLLATSSSLAGESQRVEVTRAEKTERGVLVHDVESPFQAGKTKIYVVLPDKLSDGESLRVVYVLPVEAGDGNRWGDPLGEILKHDWCNKLRLICVVPTFSHLPWYADHPETPELRQETHLLRVVLPFVEKTYPAIAEPRGRLLVGFSKSGWGAFSLLLRHPDLFGRAAAWDAPMWMEWPSRYGSNDIFGTQENFNGYAIRNLVESRAKELAGQSRLVLLGYGNFRNDHQQLREHLLSQNVPHSYRDGPRRKHAWDSGWLPEAIELLVNGADENQ